MGNENSLWFHGNWTNIKLFDFLIGRTNKKLTLISEVFVAKTVHDTKPIEKTKTPVQTHKRKKCIHVHASFECVSLSAFLQ